MPPTRTTPHSEAETDKAGTPVAATRPPRTTSETHRRHAGQPKRMPPPHDPRSLLLDSVAADATFGVYVGKAPAGIRSRLLNHERKKQWARALLIQRDNQHGLNSAHVDWLEGDLYDLFDAADRARLHNSVNRVTHRTRLRPPHSRIVTRPDRARPALGWV